MIPTLSLPNIQQPPSVEMSVFTGQNADAALGRLPIVTVPPPVNSAKVADDGRGNRQPQPTQQNAPQMLPAGMLMPSVSASGGMAFASPYSTPFVAQLFGQFQNGGLPDGLLDFDQLSQFNIVKYMPSLASRPRPETPRQAAQESVALDAPIRVKFARTNSSSAVMTETDETSFDLNTAPAAGGDMPAPTRAAEYNKPTVSTFAHGPDAYGSTQIRNEINLIMASRTPERQPVNMVL